MGDNRQASSVPHQARDVNSREIFRNPALCAQFLRDNLNIPILKQVQPEDIEDVTERYQAYFGVEFESDTVKRIRLKAEKDGGRNSPLFMISLIEHKSRVDYDVAMQLLRYMTCIWHEYAKEMENQKEGISRRKDFKYPPVLPIVYYEGNSRWTAARHLVERVGHGDAFRSFIPDFHYEVVRIHDYSNLQLLGRGDEMSLLMLLNKLQNADDFREFSQSPPEKLADVLQNADPNLIKLMQNVMYSLMMKINMPVEEANEYVKAIGGGNQMGYLFENMEKIDIQAERRKAAEARKEREEAQEQTKFAREQAAIAQEQAAAAQEQAAIAQMRAEKAEKNAESEKKEGEYKTYITTCRDFNCTKEETIKRFTAKYLTVLANSPREANEIASDRVNRYWEEDLCPSPEKSCNPGRT